MTATSKTPSPVSLLLLCSLLSAAASAGTEQLPPQLDCLIEPKVTTDISTRAQGVVAEFFADRGDYVEADQILAVLDSEVEKAAVELARTRSELVGEIHASTANLEFGRRKVNRFDDLFKQKAVSIHVLDETRTEVLLATANLRKAREEKSLAGLQLQQARRTLELRTIRSPVKGVVIDRLLTEGESVEDNPIIQVAQIDPLYVEVIVPVKHFGTVELGMQGRVRPEEPIGGEYLATVVVVDQVIDAASGTYRIRLDLPNPDYAVPAGLKCQIDFVSAYDQAKQRPATDDVREDAVPAIKQAREKEPLQPAETQILVVAGTPDAPTDLAADTINTAPPVAAAEPTVTETESTEAPDFEPEQPPAPAELMTAAQPVDPEVTAGAPQTEPVESAQQASDETVAADATFDRCFSVGPIDNVALATRFVNSVDTEVADIETREVPSKITRGYVVHSERMNSRDTLREMEASLRRAGLSDLAIIRRGSLARRLSYGVYGRQSRARQRCAQIERLGATCRMSSKPGSEPQLWVDVVFRSEEPDLSALQDWLEDSGLAGKITPEICRPEGQKSAKR